MASVIEVLWTVVVASFWTAWAVFVLYLLAGFLWRLRPIRWWD